MTVGDLVRDLKTFDQKARIVFSNDEEGNHVADIPGICKMIMNEDGTEFHYMLFPEVWSHPAQDI